MRFAAKKVKKDKELEELLKKHGLDKDRRIDRIIYHEFHGGDVKKFWYIYMYVFNQIFKVNFGLNSKS